MKTPAIDSQSFSGAAQPDPRSLNHSDRFVYIFGSLIATTHSFLEAWDGTPDDQFPALVAAFPGREQAKVIQLMFQQTGFAHSSCDLRGPGSQISRTLFAMPI